TQGSRLITLGIELALTPGMGQEHKQGDYPENAQEDDSYLKDQSDVLQFGPLFFG
ncbi:hypothetical protein PSYMO_35582, partial [Pseudomonas amygdali pv. mori str. 301020]